MPPEPFMGRTSGAHAERKTANNGSQSAAQHDASRPQFKLANLRKARPKDYAIRFIFGGAVSVIAALLGQLTTQRFGGIFTAFPAILLASLTLIGKRDGDEQSAEDAEGGVVGAIGLAACAACIALTITWLAGAASLLAALTLWFIVAIALYMLFVRIGWLRTTKSSER
jgi:uncharacterized membrane protein (GlpM family)